MIITLCRLEKAFDRISHDFMLTCFKCFNFGPDIIKWVRRKKFSNHFRVHDGGVFFFK